MKKRKVYKPFSYINQRNVQNFAKTLEEEAHKKESNIIICDRSVLDSIAYIKALGTEKEGEKLYKRMKNWITTYNHFFLLDPVGIVYKMDVIRKEDKHTRNIFHQSFLRLLQDYKLPFTLISGTKKRRVDRIASIIATFNI